MIPVIVAAVPVRADADTDAKRANLYTYTLRLLALPHSQSRMPTCEENPFHNSLLFLCEASTPMDRRAFPLITGI